MSEVLPIDKLVTEISGDNPIGDWDGSEERYSNLNRLCRATRKAESRYIDAFDDDERARLPQPDWRQVVKAASEYLSKEAKHLWVAAWLTEAAFRVHGFAGMRDGIRTIHQIIDRYWDAGFHPWPGPLPADAAQDLTLDDFEDLLSHVVSLNTMLPEAVQRLPITGPLTDRNSRAFIDFEDDGPAFRTALEKTRSAKPDFFVSQNQEMHDCINALQELYGVFQAKLEARFGSSGASKAPSFSKVEESIAAIQRLVSSMVPELKENEGGGVEVDAPDVPAAHQPGVKTAKPTVGTSFDGNVQSRDEAFKVLERVAKFFERTEPHSPISFNLRKVVRWGRMPLDDLLAEILKDGNENREGIFRLIGIPEKEETDATD